MNTYSENLLAGIKRRAQEAQGVPYETALDQLARQFGHDDGKALERALNSDTPVWPAEAEKVTQHSGFGPVTVAYSNVPAMRPTPGGPASSQTLRDFETNDQALEFICDRIGTPGFVEPLFLVSWTPETFSPWHPVDLAQEIRRRKGDAAGATDLL